MLGPRILFGFVALLWGFLALHFTMKWFERKRYESLVLVVACLSPAIHAMERVKLMPAVPLIALLSSQLVMGALGAFVIYFYASQDGWASWRNGFRSAKSMFARGGG